MNDYGPYERVHIEIGWYDGPREGICEINGKLHRFVSEFSEEMDDYTDLFKIYPVSDDIYKLEKEQWKIFVEWNYKYEKGEVSVDSHPANNNRWKEIDKLLEEERKNVPENVKVAKARFERIERKNRYEESGPDYKLSWSIL